MTGLTRFLYPADDEQEDKHIGNKDNPKYDNTKKYINLNASHYTAVSLSSEESTAADHSELSTADHAIATWQPWSLLVILSENSSNDVQVICKAFC